MNPGECLIKVNSGGVWSRGNATCQGEGLETVGGGGSVGRGDGRWGGGQVVVLQGRFGRDVE